MRSTAAVGLLLLLTSAGLLPQPGPPWVFDYAEAQRLAERQEKPLIAYFFTRWCGYCAQMERTTFRHPEVSRAMAEAQVWVKLDAEDEGEGSRVAESFSVTRYPTILRLGRDGEERDRWEGFLPAAKLLANLRKPPGRPPFARLQNEAEAQPDSPRVQYALAEAQLERGDLGAAVERFGKVLTLDPENRFGLSDKSLYYRAYALASAGDPQAALVEISELRERFPESVRLPDATMLQGQILYYRGEPAMAREVFTRFLGEFPDHPYRAWATQLISEIDMP